MKQKKEKAKRTVVIITTIKNMGLDKWMKR